MQSLILAAGMGTRLKPLTDTRPKALVEVDGETLLQCNIDKMIQAGANRIIVNVHHFAEMMVDYIGANQHRWNVPITISDERDRLLDTGGAIKQAWLQADNSEHLLVHNVDILSNIDLQGFYASHAHCDALLLVSRRQSSRYLLFDEEMRLVGWLNTKTGEVKSPLKGIRVEDYRQFAFAGIHLLSPRLISMMSDMPQRFSIIDFYITHCHKADIRGHLCAKLQLMDVGKIDTLSQAVTFKKNMALRQWVL